MFVMCDAFFTIRPLGETEKFESSWASWATSSPIHEEKLEMENSGSAAHDFHTCSCMQC